MDEALVRAMIEEVEQRITQYNEGLIADFELVSCLVAAVVPHIEAAQKASAEATPKAEKMLKDAGYTLPPIE